MYNFLKQCAYQYKGKKITLLPHDKADVDAIISCLLLKKLFNFLKINCEIVLIDKIIGKDTNDLLKMLGYNISENINETEDNTRNLFLVDHFETKHQGKIVGIIDHHFTTYDTKCDLYMYRDYPSASMIIFEMMKEVEQKIDEESAKLTVFATLVDTASFVSDKFKPIDEVKVKQIAKDYNFDYEKMREISLLRQDTKMLTAKEIAEWGLRIHVSPKDGLTVYSSYLQMTAAMNDKCKSTVAEYIRKRMKQDNIYFWTFVAYDMSNLQDIKSDAIFFITNPERTYEVRYTGYIGRGKIVEDEMKNVFE